MTAAEIVILVLVLVLVPLVPVGGVFVWAARKDGEEDRAVQRAPRDPSAHTARAAGLALAAGCR